MSDQVLEGQQKLAVQFNGKIYAIYIYMNGEFEALNIHAKKLKTKVVQTNEAVGEMQH